MQAIIESAAIKIFDNSVKVPFGQQPSIKNIEITIDNQCPDVSVYKLRFGYLNVGGLNIGAKSITLTEALDSYLNHKVTTNINEDVAYSLYLSVCSFLIANINAPGDGGHWEDEEVLVVFYQNNEVGQQTEIGRPRTDEDSLGVKNGDFSPCL